MGARPRPSNMPPSSNRESYANDMQMMGDIAFKHLMEILVKSPSRRPKDDLPRASLPSFSLPLNPLFSTRFSISSYFPRSLFSISYPRFVTWRFLLLLQYLSPSPFSSLSLSPTLTFPLHPNLLLSLSLCHLHPCPPLSLPQHLHPSPPLPLTPRLIPPSPPLAFLSPSFSRLYITMMDETV